MQLRELYQGISGRLAKIYPKEEAANLTLWLLEHYLGKNKLDLLKNEQVKLIPSELESAVQDLESGKPIQYILGIAPFYGREFFVNPSVLIPRNETEELVHLIIKENRQQGLRILDIGTGSGCIAISLKLEMEEAAVFGIDLSLDALSMATENANNLNAEVIFSRTDILRSEIPMDHLDIIVSNPPYVLKAEKALMQKNVLEHEPHLALFVADEDPLIFYRHIAQKGKGVLMPQGKLYFEINEKFGSEVVLLLQEEGFHSIEKFQDLNGKDRMVRGVWG